MKEQIQAVANRLGMSAADEYAARTLQVYRKCAKDRKHFAHIMPFRPHFVRALLYLRKYFRGWSAS